MSEDIYQNLKYHGQKIVSSVLNQDNLIQSLSNNLSTLVDDNNNLKKK